jgi:hypothetical protein
MLVAAVYLHLEEATPDGVKLMLVKASAQATELQDQFFYLI